MPLVINSLRGGHTHAEIRTETILRNQVHTGYRPACAWINSSNQVPNGII